MWGGGAGCKGGCRSSEVAARKVKEKPEQQKSSKEGLGEARTVEYSSKEV